LRAASSGHAYFTLKDDAAQIRCALFRSRARRGRVALEGGLPLLAFGGVDGDAAPGGDQPIVEPGGPQGARGPQCAVRPLKKKLAAEGLVDAARKRPLPSFPRTIGIVTSPTGAVLRDMLHVIGRRFGDIRVLVAPVRVQGDGAALEIIAALRDLAVVPEID